MVCVCMIQDGQIPAETRAALEAGLADVAREVLGEYAAEFQVMWMPIAVGSGYTAGKPSATSLAGLSVPDGTAPVTREALLSGVCAKWAQIAGCSVNEIVATAFDESAMPQTI